MSEHLLAISGLRAGYGTTEILRGVDLTVGEGEIVAVLGSNGTGKSTLNRTISGLMRATHGTIRFRDAAIEQEPPKVIVARGLIHVPEGRRIFPNLTVGEISISAPIAAPAHDAKPTGTECSRFSRGSWSGRASAPEPYPAANNRCSPSGAD
jgi:ABC-type branched-subunit amino acid transport system ATPase component